MIKKFTSLSRNLCAMSPVLTLLAGLLQNEIANAQITNSPIVQSTYYDALSLYYAINNYKAYPIQMSDIEVTALNVTAATSVFFDGQSPSNNPGPTNNSKRYKIIESSTGKVIMDNCDSAKVISVLKNNQFIDDERNDFIYEVLARNVGAPGASKDSIDKLYADNVYLSNSIHEPISFLKDTTNFKPNLFFKEANTFSLEGGGLSTTQILEGVTEFIIDAVNKEINEAFFVHLKKILESKDELKILFPQSLNSLTKIEVTKYASSLNALKAAFREDIKNILSNIGQLAELKKYQDLVDAHPALTIVFTACDLISLIRNDAVPGEILYQLNNAPYIVKCAPNNYSSTIKLAALISNSLRNIRINDENTNMIGWIDRSNLTSLKEDKLLFQVFMGLFAQQAHDIKFKTDRWEFDFKKSLFDKKQDILKTQYLIYNFSETIKKINDGIANAKTLWRSSAKRSDFLIAYQKVANDIIGLSENCLDILPTNDITINVRREIKNIKIKYIPLVAQANTVISKIEDKEYSMALYEADTLLRQIFENSNSNDEWEKIRDHYLKYGLFICAIAEAKTSADVKEAINAVALPTGSSRIKKENKFSIGLNSYVGVHYAWNRNYSTNKLPHTETGITVPIGFGLNWGNFLGNGSFSIYGGVLDIGAIFTYKVNTDGSVKSDIELGQVLSPSIGLVYGLPVINNYNIPLSIGCNYQWGPKLKKVADTGNSVLPLLSQRINVFIGVDIPFVNFHVSKK